MPTRTIWVAGIVLLAGRAFADEVAIKSTSVVNVRSGPGSTYGVIGTVPQGHTYVAFERTGDWWKIWYDGGFGWTHASYYRTLVDTTGVKVAASALNVRSGPGSGTSIIGRVYYGQIYFWTAHKDIEPWYKVTFDGGVGYCHGGYLTKVALRGAVPPVSGSVRLAVTYFPQETGYYCGPATVQMIVHHISGSFVSQPSIAAYVGTSSSTGTTATGVTRGINHFASSSYRTVEYSRERVLTNLDRGKPVNANMRCKYLAYWNFEDRKHHSPVIGYTSGGFWMHDSWVGAGKWTSSTELHNAIVYHYNLTCVRH